MNFAFVAAAFVSSSVTTASVPVIRTSAPAPVRVAAQPATVGVVERIRRIEHGGSQPATFEFTVRMRDGSARTSSGTSASKWRTGDRIMLIGGGAETPAATQH